MADVKAFHVGNAKKVWVEGEYGARFIFVDDAGLAAQRAAATKNLVGRKVATPRGAYTIGNTPSKITLMAGQLYLIDLDHKITKVAKMT